jgi:hypothetical protein
VLLNKTIPLAVAEAGPTTSPPALVAQEVSVPLVVKYLPELPVWLGARALKAALAVVCPVPP